MTRKAKKSARKHAERALDKQHKRDLLKAHRQAKAIIKKTEREFRKMEKMEKQRAKRGY